MGSTFHSVHIHAIFTCKDRRPLITPEIEDRLYSYISGIADKRRCRLVIGGGYTDHSQLLIGVNMTTAIADLLRDIKANTSRWVHETWPDVEFGWQDGYGAFSVSVSMVEKTKAYIAGQHEHHKTQSVADELRKFAALHGMQMLKDGSFEKADDSAAPDGAGANVGNIDSGG
ncbi:MAG: transposase [Planctomycetes bacterium]|nr:transposase [Planctomycetota bacterium]